MLEKPSKCQGCPFEHIGRGFVAGVGPRDAKAVIIGEAPAENEISSDIPFSGKAGMELDDMVSGAGLRRSELFITNAVKCAFPYELSDQQKHTWARACYARHGENELASLRPNAVALLGNIALSTYTGLSGISKHRGYCEVSDSGIKFIPILHPAATMDWYRSRKFRPVARQDWRKFARLSQLEGKPQLDEKFIINPSFIEAKQFLERIISLKLPCSYDIETTGLNIKDCTVMCIGIGDGERVLVIPFWRDNGEAYWDPIHLRALVIELSMIFSDPAIVKIAANMCFDESVLQLRGFVFRGPRLDVMYLHHVLFAELLHRLAFLGSVYTDAPFWKDDVKGYNAANSSEEKGVDEVYWTYNAKDVHYTGHKIAPSIVAEATARNKLSFYERIVAPAIPAIVDMQATGILFDSQKRDSIAATMSAEIQTLEARAFEWYGKPFQIGSQTELGRIVFEELGYKPQRFTEKTGKPSMDKDTVRWLYHNAHDPRDVEFFRILKQYNEQYKLYSTYVMGEDIVPCSDGRIRASWKIHGTKTGRLACGEPNLMNVPDGAMREMYIASPGRRLIYMDMDSFEAWAGALVAQDLPMLEVLRTGRSPHLANAVTFGVCGSYEEAKSLRAEGDASFAQTYLALKNYYYGEQYGAEPKTIHGEMYARMDHPPALEVVARWHSLHQAAHPAFTTMRREIAERLRTTRLLTNGFGRERYHLGPPHTIITEGYNFPIQSLGADILLQIQARLFRELPITGIIVAQIHDALLMDVPVDMFDDVIGLAKEIATSPFTFNAWHGELVTHSFPVAFKVGDNWGCLEEYKVN